MSEQEKPLATLTSAFLEPLKLKDIDLDLEDLLLSSRAIKEQYILLEGNLAAALALDNAQEAYEIREALKLLRDLAGALSRVVKGETQEEYLNTSFFLSAFLQGFRSGERFERLKNNVV